MTMLIMWLIELYLNDLGTLKEEGAGAKKEDLEEEFRKFLAQTKVKVSGTKPKGSVMVNEAGLARSYSLPVVNKPHVLVVTFVTSPLLVRSLLVDEIISLRFKEHFAWRVRGFWQRGLSVPFFRMSSGRLCNKRFFAAKVAKRSILSLKYVFFSHLK